MSNAKRPKNYLPFLIAVGEAGSYKESMVYQNHLGIFSSYCVRFCNRVAYRP